MTEHTRGWYPRCFEAMLLGIYACAFASVGSQLRGLFGFDGLEPADQFLQSFSGTSARVGWDVIGVVPTLAWLSGDVKLPPDVILHVLCAAGVLVAISSLWIGGNGISFATLWVLYLSIFTVGQTFLSFQWCV